MIYLTNGNMPLNAAYADEIVQEENSTYQLSFRFPTSDPLWEKLKEETFLTADDLHGEQDFVIFEVEKKHGYIQVYANQVFTLLNNYVVNPISLDRQTGSTALSRFAGSITRDNPFSFFSDIEDRHTFNIGSKNAMEAFAKDKHSIIGQWGGDLVRHGYQVRLLKNGGSENESLFMYKKNLSSYQHKTSTKSLKTRITFIATVKGEGEKAPDRTFTVTIDSPLINKYSQIYEDVIEVNDQDVKDEASLRKYGEQYYRTSLCDMMEDSLEIEVVGQSDVPVQMFDVVSIFHERYNLDVRKKITKYTYSPMAKKLKSIGFGQFQSGLANAIGNAVSDAVKGEAQQLQDDFERQLVRELKNADLAFDRKTEELQNEFTDGLNAAKTRAEEVKRELSDIIDQRFNSFDNGPLQEAKRRAEEALRNAGASSLLAQEAKRIGLDSIAKLEEFKKQATSAQTALSGDLDVLKLAIVNDIRPKQEQVTAEIEKQVKALIQTKNELSGIKSAQATYEETMTRRLAELTNLADGKASKSELTQTAEELTSKIASVQASGRNLFLNSLFKKDISKTGIWTTSTYEATIDSTDKYLGHNALKIVGQNPSGRDNGNPKITYPAFGQFGKVISGSTTNQDVTISFYAKASKNGILLRSRLGNINYKTGNVILSTEIKRYVVHIPKGWTNESKFSTNEWLFNFNQEGTVWIWMPKFEISDVDTSYSEAPEDIEGQISAVESNFKQRADALDAGVIRLTEGLRTKADISSLNVTAENIRQSVKRLETDTQNKLNQKLSLAEFEVQAGSIRQEILNATKDKADKTLVTTEAGKLREEFSNLRVGGTNLLKGSKGPFMPDRKPANFDNNVLYAGQTSIYMEQGQEYIISAKTDGTFTAHHDGNKESDNVVLWIMDKDVRNYQIVSDLKTGTTGTKIIWNKPTGIYHLRVNTYHKEATKSVWDVKIEKGNVATDWSPAPEDTDGLITEAKAIFERTAQGLRTDLSAIQEYVNKDGQRQDALQRYAREESAKQATAVRELVARDYVGKSTYQEDVRGLERRFEAITNPQNGSIATQIANYKTAVDGRFSDITSLIAGKANQTDFQRVKETSQLYERILGNSENGIADKIARMAMTNQLFQVEVSKVFENHRNLFLSSTATKGFLGNAGVINVANSTQKEITSDFISVEPNEKIIFQHWVTLPENGMAWTAWQFFDKNKNPIDNRKPGLNAYKTTVGKQHNINQITVPTNAYFVRFSARMYDDGLIKVEHGSVPSDYSVAPNDALEAVKTVQRQLAGSWAVQNINGVGSIVSQINATNNQILIEAEKIRLKGKTLLDELTAIQGYFKRLFVGEGAFAKLNAEIIGSKTITADKLIMDQAMARLFVSSNIFTDALAAKEAFINKLRSVVVTATLLEGFQGLIGGFRFGQYPNRNGYFITGISSVSVGMGNGTNAGANRNAFWANWGESLDTPGPKAWYVNTDGKMYCRNEATFHSKVDFSSISNPNFYSKIKAHKGVWVGTDDVNGEGDNPDGGYNRVVWWSQIVTGKWRQYAGITTASDKKLKENIESTPVRALDKINVLNLVAFDYIKDKTHEEIGLIAQEVQDIIPSAVLDDGNDSYLSIQYSKFVPYLIKAVQELHKKIEKLEKIA
ncbi:phage tail spike protein [Streptococcus mitis]|nr:phage tail spike protein [Streptococcus mitis]MDK6637069.1 phage tail spike protein [Streptococcus mitis]